MSTAPDGEATTRHGVAPGACALSRLDRIRIGIVVVLLGMTIAWFNLFPRYQQSGEDLQHNGRFERGLEDWSVRGPAGAVSVDAGSARLELANPDRTARLSQVLVLGPEQRTLGMTFEASSRGVVPGNLT